MRTAAFWAWTRIGWAIAAAAATAGSRTTENDQPPAIPSALIRGTEVAALFYSLIESAKLCGVEPKAYLLSATRAALEKTGTVTLPHALLAS